MATKKSPAKKKKESFKIANREITNGAFLMILIICMVVACLIGWIIGYYCPSIF